MTLAARLRRKIVSLAAGLALRHAGSQPPTRQELDQAVQRDWKHSAPQLGLRRHTPWHDRFRRTWLRLFRGE